MKFDQDIFALTRKELYETQAKQRAAAQLVRDQLDHLRKHFINLADQYDWHFRQDEYGVLDPAEKERIRVGRPPDERTGRKGGYIYIFPDEAKVSVGHMNRDARKNLYDTLRAKNNPFKESTGIALLSIQDAYEHLPSVLKEMHGLEALHSTNSGRQSRARKTPGRS